MSIRSRSARWKLVAALVALVALLAPFASAVGIPVIDAANLAENILIQISTWLNEINTYIDMVTTIDMYLKMVYEGEWYDLLFSLIGEFTEVYPDHEVGVWMAEIEGLRNLALGVSSSYSSTQDELMQVFGLPETEIRTNRAYAVNATDATIARSLKEIGRLRSMRADRKAEADKILDKVNGSTSEKKVLQGLAAAQVEALKGQNDMILSLTSIAESQAMLLALEREKLEREELGATWVAEGLVELYRLEAEGEMFYAVIPEESWR